MRHKLYTIQVGKNTYVDWCDNNWYGGVNYPVHKFTLEEAKDIVQKMVQHFKYKAIITNNEENYYYEFGNEVKTKPEFREVVHPVIIDDDDIENNDINTVKFNKTKTSVLDCVQF